MSVLEKFKLVELITTRTDAVATFITGNQIKFNSATHVDLGYPAYIQMFVDDKGKQFAIKACKETDPNAIKFSKPAGEQRYPIKLTCAPAANAVRKVTLTAGTVAVYYSLDFSYANYEQSRARIRRIGQTKRGVYIHLVCKDTIDEKVMAALKQKADVSKLLVDDYKKLIGG